MKLTISERAAQWYIDELDLNGPTFIRLFVRYGGHSPIQSGFSLGINQEKPENEASSTTSLGVTFYVEDKDLWYFDGHDLNIVFNEKLEEPEFHYQK